MMCGSPGPKTAKKPTYFTTKKTSATVYRLNVTSGQRQIVGQNGASRYAGVTSISNVLYTPDGKAYAYSDTQELSELP